VTADPSGLTQLLERQEVVDLTVRYCWAIDHRRFDDLSDVFAPDATADYGSIGVLRGPQAIAAACAAALAPYDRTQHTVTNHQMVFEGDRGTNRCYFRAQHTRAGADGDVNYVVAGSYLDDIVRTPGGWRIAARVLRVTWRTGTPPPSPLSGQTADASGEVPTAFVIAGWLDVDPDRVADLLAAGVEMTQATAQEPGNLDYVFSADPSHLGRIRVFERWRSDADLRGHFDTTHMATFQRALRQADVRGSSLERYRVDRVGPVFGP
jgi:quinol monooxygenase YgiN